MHSRYQVSKTRKILVYSISSLIRTSLIRILVYPNPQIRWWISLHVCESHYVVMNIVNVVHLSELFTYLNKFSRPVATGVRISEDLLYYYYNITQENRAWNVVPSHLLFYSVVGMMETPFFTIISNILDHNSTMFAVRHWFKRRRITEQIRNRTVPIIVRNRLNFLSNNEEHGLLGIPAT